MTSVAALKKSLSLFATTMLTPAALDNLTVPVEVVSARMSPIDPLLIAVTTAAASRAEDKSTDVPLILKPVADDGLASPLPEAKLKVKSRTLLAVAVTPCSSVFSLIAAAIWFADQFQIYRLKHH